MIISGNKINEIIAKSKAKRNKVAKVQATDNKTTIPKTAKEITIEELGKLSGAEQRKYWERNRNKILPDAVKKTFNNK